VRAGLNAIERNRPLVVPGFLVRLGMLIVRMTPMSLLRFASRFSLL
jgi:hypothetical protein